MRSFITSIPIPAKRYDFLPTIVQLLISLNSGFQDWKSYAEDQKAWDLNKYDLQFTLVEHSEIRRTIVIIIFLFIFIISFWFKSFRNRFCFKRLIVK